MMKLTVPSADGGEEEGLNDAGVQLFLGSVEEHIARETHRTPLMHRHPVHRQSIWHLIFSQCQRR